MKLERIDAFDINFVDSAARIEFKLDGSTGTGESRIYVGHDEEKLDEFFDFENIEYFVTEKKDLVQYMDDAYQEYMFPSQNYRSNITEMYEQLRKDTLSIETELIKYEFRKTYDGQNRYYLVLKEKTGNRKNYSYIRNIALPRVTKYCFVKLKDVDTNKLFIYMRPIMFNDLQAIEIVENLMEEVSKKDESTNKKRNSRIKQAAYRSALLDVMPFCPFTNVADDRLLVACHIKPYSVCTEEERYDSKNGITMTPTYHTLFDLGFISFENDGTLLISPFMSNITKKRLNLHDKKSYRLQTGSDKYLEYHRNNIFCKIPNIELNDVEE